MPDSIMLRIIIDLCIILLYSFLFLFIQLFLSFIFIINRENPFNPLSLFITLCHLIFYFILLFSYNLLLFLYCIIPDHYPLGWKYVIKQVPIHNILTIYFYEKYKEHIHTSLSLSREKSIPVNSIPIYLLLLGNYIIFIYHIIYSIIPLAGNR